MNQFRQDFNKAVEASIPVFVRVAKLLAGVVGAAIWVSLNIMLCESVGAVLTLWIITAACVIVAIQYHRVVHQREEEARTAAYYAKRDAEWEAKYGVPYPR